ncbi:MAG: GNAT family N-acetyltransferase [Rhodoplanes sp.]|uniref:GNAT family N-acetyltransferase n=1 Tax=Rhodoplanes sp. TaxID=1968906 RepID=UPI00183E115F|nr:GNAT family N-acetyltransferase [Rhodoplanes sp.]NVO15097.1 GNAT family N-acetyltransferase [Rhodoplanes sp.]
MPPDPDADSVPADPVTLRPATPADAAALDALLAESYPTLLAGHYDAETLARALPPMTRANPGLLAAGTYYVAATAGRIVACGGWTAEQPGTGTVAAGEAHIRHFAALPAFTGRGIGTAVLARCIAETTARDLTTLTCFSTLNAVPFYARSGFVALGPLAVTLAPGVVFPAVLMRRTG